MTLIERIEGAEGPSRELDVEIAARLIKSIGNSHYPTVDLWVAAALKQNWNVTRYTASLDAAMSLVPEGAEWGLSWGTMPSGSKTALARILLNGSAFDADAATPALALCAAALRAIGDTHDD